MKYRKFALALGGGSAKGFAHIGVIRFLQENNIIPAKICGTSMGAIIGSLYALGFSHQKMREILGSVGMFSVLEWHIGRGILSMQKVKKILAEHIGDKKFSDTKIPLAIVAVNIDTGEKKIFSEWKILDAICASIAIPWIFHPYKIGQERFIDGGMRENLPLSACENFPIIASSVVSSDGIDFSKIPVLMRSFVMIQEAVSMLLEEQEKFSLSHYNDVLLVSTKEKTTGYMDFSHIDIMANAGYNSAKNSHILTFLNQK